MIIALNVETGKGLFFTTKKEACFFLGLTPPTLRKYMKKDFYLHKSWILSESSQSRIAETKRVVAVKGASMEGKVSK